LKLLLPHARFFPTISLRLRRASEVSWPASMSALCLEEEELLLLLPPPPPRVKQK
jgi:hypothetical protein